MKKTKKIFALLLALVMAMAMNISVFAANGIITITNATVGETYSAYKLFDATYNTITGTTSYTVKDTDSIYAAIQTDSDSPFTISTVPDSNGNYAVTRKADVSDAQITNWVSGLNMTTLGITSSASQEATSDTVTLNVSYGYYYVTSTLGSVVTIDSNTPSVEVIDKNQDGGSDFTKTVDGTDEVVQIGEEFDFTLVFNATNYDGETPITEYKITDVIPTGMDLVGNDTDSYGVNVSVGETLVDDATVNYEDKTLTITIPWQKDNSFKYYSPSEVTVTYTVKLNADAPIQQNIENNAKLTWTGDDNGRSTTETVQTYALAIMKVDNKGTALSGATFAVTVDEEAVNVSPVAGQEGVYVVDPTSSSNLVVSPKSGLIIIKGVDNIDYTLTETIAPEGYNLLTTPETVTPASTGSTAITIYYDSEGNVVKEEVAGGSSEEVGNSSNIPVTYSVVVNEAGSLLPSTGGVGTTIIYIAGIALVLGAGIVLVVRRRMNSDR